MEGNQNGKDTGRAVLYGGVISSPAIKTDSRSPFLNYGRGFFETVLYENGKLHHFQEHLERMEKTCRDFEIQLDYSQVEKEKVYTYLKTIGLENHCSRVKIIYAPIEKGNRWETLVSAAPYTRPARDFVLSVHNEVYDSKLNRYKSLNYEYNLYWKKYYGEKEHSDEVLFCNKEGNILEGSYTNLLYTKNSTLYYVDKKCNYLNGIMQDQILKTAAQIDRLKIGVLSNGISINLLKEADEILICNSLIQVQNVGRIIYGDEIFKRPSSTAGDSLAKKLRNKIIS